VRYTELLLSLLPPSSYSPSGERIQAEARAEAGVLERIETGARQALTSITPISAVDTLPDWERVCGLAVRVSASRQERVNGVLAKLRELGGLSIPYFKGLAQSLGYDIEITEFEPFYLDRSCLDRDILYVPDVVWVWQVSVTGGQVRAFPFHLDLSSVDEALLSFSDAVIESYFKDLKPAHTFVLFDYQEHLS